ncbi:MAG: carboxypeptidase-like regulatory domain-containing protein [Paludibaculum sp.]
MRPQQTAAILLILIMRPTGGQPQRTSSISGQVLNATTGEPLRRAAVTILMDGREDVRGMAATGDAGQFLLRLLPPAATASKSPSPATVS